MVVMMGTVLCLLGSSMAIFGLLLRMWVVAGLCGGGALGGAWAKQGVRSCLSSLECFVGSHLDRSQKNSDLSHQIFLAHITLPASLLSGLIALGAGVMRMMRMMVIKDWDWGGFRSRGWIGKWFLPVAAAISSAALNWTNHNIWVSVTKIYDFFVLCPTFRSLQRLLLWLVWWLMIAMIIVVIIATKQTIIPKSRSCGLVNDYDYHLMIIDSIPSADLNQKNIPIMSWSV